MGKSAKRLGLVLDLPGAPHTAHTIPGVDGYYFPHKAVPLEASNLDEKQAKEHDKSRGFPLRLVEMPVASDGREVWDAYARDLNQDPEAFASKDDLIAALEGGRAEPEEHEPQVTSDAEEAAV